MPTDRIGSLDTSRIARIMTVALEEFSSGSYHQSSYNRIIRKSGLSKGTMYYYFKSKEDLFLTLMNALSKDFGNLFPPASSLANSSFGFWGEVQSVLDGLIGKLTAKPFMSSFLRGLFSPSSRREADHPGTHLLNQVDSYLHQCIKAGQKKQAIRTDLSDKVLIQLLWSLWDIEDLWCFESDSSCDKRRASDLIDLATRMLSVR